jgi:hypothetical protein
VFSKLCICTVESKLSNADASLITGSCNMDFRIIRLHLTMWFHGSFLPLVCLQGYLELEKVRVAIVNGLSDDVEGTANTIGYSALKLLTFFFLYQSSYESRIFRN